MEAGNPYKPAVFQTILQSVNIGKDKDTMRKYIEQDLFALDKYTLKEKYIIVGNYAILDNGHSPSAVLHAMYECKINPLDFDLYMAKSKHDQREHLLSLGYVVIVPKSDELIDPRHIDISACAKPSRVREWIQ